MSTILKALQKIEPERSESDFKGFEPDQRVPADPPMYKIGLGNDDASARNRNRRQSAKESKRGVTTALIILIVVVVGGGWLYVRPSKDSIEKQKIKTFTIAKAPSEKDAFVNTDEVESKGVESRQAATKPSIEKKPRDEGKKIINNTLAEASPEPQTDAVQPSVRSEIKESNAPEPAATSSKPAVKKESATASLATPSKKQVPAKKVDKPPRIQGGRENRRQAR